MTIWIFDANENNSNMRWTGQWTSINDLNVEPFVKCLTLQGLSTNFDADFIILAFKNRVDFFAVLAKMTRKTHNF